MTVWEPPSRFVYLWHLRRDRADATEVEIRFIERGDATTLVEIEHRGWEALGAEGESWRDRNHGGWATLLPHFVAAARPAAARRRPSQAPQVAAASANEAMSGKVASGVGVGGRRRARARPVVAAVDPDGREPEPLGRHVVVEEALGDVQDALARQPDPLERDLEVARVGLVAAAPTGRSRPSRTSSRGAPPSARTGRRRSW